MNANNSNLLEQILARLAAVERKLDDLSARLTQEILPARETEYRDILAALQLAGQWLPEGARIEAERVVASSSHDHVFPRGAIRDNTRYPRWVSACERLKSTEQLTVLDIGCAGGGLVLDFVLRGHRAFGVEGSDHPAREVRGEWRLLRDLLFTADATAPFRLYDRHGIPISCDLVTAWEVMEHIPESGLEAFLDNVSTHLKHDGWFCGSIAMFADEDPTSGAVWHVTLKPRQWWCDRFAASGLRMIDDHGFSPYDFPRGHPHGRYTADFVTNPAMGFHFVAKR